MPGKDDLPTEFYRWMAEVEYEDWKSTGRLRLADGHTEGKHLTITAEFASQWGRLFRELGWESGPGHVMKVVFPPEVVRFIEPLAGSRIDNIGPAYLARVDALEHAEVMEVLR